MKELKACPFCGNSEELLIVSDTWHRRYRVECESCKSTGPEEYTRREAIHSWEVRADNE